MEEGSPVYLFNGTVIGYILIKNAPKRLTLIWKAKVKLSRIKNQVRRPSLITFVWIWKQKIKHHSGLYAPLRVARTLTNVFVAFDFIDKYSRVLSA